MDEPTDSSAPVSDTEAEASSVKDDTPNLDQSSGDHSQIPYYAIPPWLTVDQFFSLTDSDLHQQGLNQNSETRFEDPTNALIPSYLKVATWIEPNKIFKKPIVHKDTELLDLISPNAHLIATSSLLRKIITEISELYDAKQLDPFFCTSDDPVSSSPFHPWRPWNHIISLNKANRKKLSQSYHKSGQYAVRLFYMGHWRLIFVDDRIPILPSGLFALPITNDFHLWPMLLTKALLKIACLKVGAASFADPQFGFPFSFIPYLTGWIWDKESFSEPLDPEIIWNYAQEILPHYNPRKTLTPTSFPTDALFPCDVIPKRKRSKKKKKGSKRKKKRSGKSKSKSKSKSPKGKSRSRGRKKGKSKSPKRGKRKKKSKKSSSRSSTESCTSEVSSILSALHEPSTKKPLYLCIGDQLPPIDDVISEVQALIGSQQRSVVKQTEKEVERDSPVVALSLMSEVSLIEQYLPDPPLLALMRQTRNRPVGSEEEEPCPLPLWKTYRWKAWAMEQGIIPKDSEKLEQEQQDLEKKYVQLVLPGSLKSDWDSCGTGVDETNLEEVLSRLKIPPNAKGTDLGDYLYDAANPGPKGKQKKSKKKKRKSKKGKKSRSKSKKGKNSRSKSKKKKKSKSKKKKSKSKSKKGSKESKPPKNTAVEFWEDVQDFSKSTEELHRFYSPNTPIGSYYVIAVGNTIHPFKNGEGGSGQKAKSKSKSPKGKKKKKKSKSKKRSRSKSKKRSKSTSKSKSSTRSEPEYCKEDDFAMGQMLAPQTGKYLKSDEPHLVEFTDPHSGLYLFSDSWTNQNILLSLDTLDGGDVESISDQITTGTGTDPVFKKTLVNGKKKTIFLILMPWNLFNPNPKSKAFVLASSANFKSTTMRISLPPGRHVFRLWISSSKHASVRAIEDPGSKVPGSAAVVRILSKPPIYIGASAKVQNLMSRPPVLFLHLCDQLSRAIWALLLSFGKRKLMNYSLQHLREAYRPRVCDWTKEVPRGVLHECFDRAFLFVLEAANGGPFGKWTVLALRTLLLNPTLGRIPLADPEEVTTLRRRPCKYIEGTQDLKRKTKANLDICSHLQEAAAIEIQRFYRGWRVRRLFQLRKKSDPNFQHVEQGVRKITYLLAANLGAHSLCERKSDKVLFPQPPAWCAEIVLKLLGEHPALHSKYHVDKWMQNYGSIDETKGLVPHFDACFEWVPFLWTTMNVQETTVYHMELHLEPNFIPRDVFLAIINNDTLEQVPVPNGITYAGSLEANEYGYTVMAYKMYDSEVCKIQERPKEQQSWSFREIAEITDLSSFSVQKSKEKQQAPTLKLHQFQGYYYPNDDNCVCRFEMEFLDMKIPRAFALRFKAGAANADLKLLIRVWSQNDVGGSLLFEREFGSELKVPAVALKKLTTLENGGGDFVKEPTVIVISVFVVGNSWELREDQASFLQEQFQKFWQEIPALRHEDPFKRTSSDFGTSIDDSGNDEETSTSPKMSLIQLARNLQTTNQESEISDATEVLRPATTLPAETENLQPDISLEVEPDLTNVEESALAQVGSRMRSLGNESTYSVNFQFPPKSTTTSENLTVQTGTEATFEVKDPTQPHWTMEVLLPADTEVAFRNNLREMQQNMSRYIDVFKGGLLESDQDPRIMRMCVEFDKEEHLAVNGASKITDDDSQAVEEESLEYSTKDEAQVEVEDAFSLKIKEAYGCLQNNMTEHNRILQVCGPPLTWLDSDCIPKEQPAKEVLQDQPEPVQLEEVPPASVESDTPIFEVEIPVSAPSLVRPSAQASATVTSAKPPLPTTSSTFEEVKPGPRRRKTLADFVVGASADTKKKSRTSRKSMALTKSKPNSQESISTTLQIDTHRTSLLPDLAKRMSRFRPS